MKLKKIIIFAALFMSISLIFLNKGIVDNSLAAQNEFSSDEIIVKYKNKISDTLKEDFIKQFKIQRKNRINKLRADVLKIPEGQTEELINAFKKDPRVEYAEPNYKAEAFVVTNDPSLSNQWGLFKIDAAENSGVSAWDVTTGSSSVKVAVLDTGIEESHQDIVGKVVASANFTDSPTSQDLDGHGTHVAGIVSASTNNNNGVAGVGYNVTLMNGKVLDDTGSGYYSWIASGIVWATDNGAKVINMSLGGSSSSQTLKDAIDYAWNNGVVIVAAAGNNGSSLPSYPAYYGNTIAVAATDSSDAKASWSNYGSWVDVAAPGVSIYSTVNNNSYAYYSGTSMASPYVAGLAGLVWSKGDCVINSCVRQKIESSADKISGTGNLWVHGRINAYNAVVLFDNTITPTATPTPTFTPTPTPTQVPQNIMTATGIEMWKSGSRIYARVTVRNQWTNTVISSARVYYIFERPSGSKTISNKLTNSSGQATFSISSREKGTFTVTVTDITKTSYTYFPTLTTQSLTVN